MLGKEHRKDRDKKREEAVRKVKVKRSRNAGGGRRSEGIARSMDMDKRKKGQELQMKKSVALN